MSAILFFAGVWLCLCALSCVALLLLAFDAITNPDDEPRPESDPGRAAAAQAEWTRLTLAFLDDDEAQWEAERDQWRRTQR